MMSAYDELLELVKETDIFKETVRSLEEEPIRVFGDICREFEKTGKPIPDHNINILGYFGDLSLRILSASGLIKALPVERLALRRYRPTEKGLDIYKRLVAEGFFSKE